MARLSLDSQIRESLLMRCAEVDSSRMCKRSCLQTPLCWGHREQDDRYIWIGG